MYLADRSKPVLPKSGEKTVVIHSGGIFFGVFATTDTASAWLAKRGEDGRVFEVEIR